MMTMSKTLILKEFGKDLGEYLGRPHFMMMFGFAVMLHLLALLGWSMMPAIRIIDIPIHAMNIRLGRIVLGVGV